MIRKEFEQLRRDRRTVAMLVAVPLLMLVVFGYAARFDVETVRTAVLGQAPPAGALSAAFDILETVPADADPVDVLRRNDIDAVLIPSEDRVLVDGTNLFAGQLVQRLTATSPLQAEVLFNPDLDTTTVMVPALVGLIMLFIGALATSLGVVRERQTGTMEQLAVMPFSPTDLFVGKLAPYLAIAVLDLLVIVGVGLLVFSVPFVGSPLLFAAGAGLFLFVALSLGVLISTVSDNQGQAVQLALMVLLPQVMLSGLIFPIESMAGPLQVVARVLPLTWFNEIARGVMIRGAGMAEVWVPMVVLVGMGGVVFLAAIRRFGRVLTGGAA
ncbi:ABC-type multidrug transport system, permease component [Euzebya pacifica]|uniref:ABC-type multidrug transport system, permease component n=1 Tax=Euzebya pacifica TaxID=1608957 RepID=A0A346XZL7_9ACTN|nr:ABC transporter permease [Euzebya pacifica]AXV07664.1 ABC-type multidrug transport system, permease component [Euzebya pacifica]